MHRLAPLLLALTACYASHGVGEEDRPTADGFVPAIDGGPIDRPMIDGGPIVEGPVLTDCIEAAERGREGQRCSFEGQCFADDLCVSVDVRCLDGRLFVRDTRATPRERFEPGACVSFAGMAAITGRTPAGPIELSIAWASHSFAFAVDAVLVAHDGREVELSACVPDRIGFRISPMGPSYLGVHEVTVLVTAGDLEPTLVPGVFEVFETDDAPFIGGNLRVDHGEWQLDGFIAAPPCPELDRSGP